MQVSWSFLDLAVVVPRCLGLSASLSVWWLSVVDHVYFYADQLIASIVPGILAFDVDVVAF